MRAPGQQALARHQASTGLRDSRLRPRLWLLAELAPLAPDLVCLAALGVAGCQAPAAQQLKSDVRTLPDVFRTGVADAKTAVQTVVTGLRPAPEQDR